MSSADPHTHAWLTPPLSPQLYPRPPPLLARKMWYRLAFSPHSSFLGTYTVTAITSPTRDTSEQALTRSFIYTPPVRSRLSRERHRASTCCSRENSNPGLTSAAPPPHRNAGHLSVQTASALCTSCSMFWPRALPRQYIKQEGKLTSLPASKTIVKVRNFLSKSNIQMMRFNKILVLKLQVSSL